LGECSNLRITLVAAFQSPAHFILIYGVTRDGSHQRTSGKTDQRPGRIAADRLTHNSTNGSADCGAFLGIVPGGTTRSQEESCTDNHGSHAIPFHFSPSTINRLPTEQGPL
jgi:hypothetical protein